MKPSSCLLRAVLGVVAGVALTARVPAGSRTVTVNQLGYPSMLPKYAFSSLPADSFRVVQVGGGTLYRGPMVLWKTADGATGRTVYRGDFSVLRQAGEYRVVTSRGDTSCLFAIADSVYDPLYRSALRGFYFQRCGTALLAAHAGVYQHPPCHPLDGTYHSSTDTTGFHLATGGWHDAGDYGKYVVNAGISAGTLLLAYEMFPSRFGGDDLGIPESGNGVPDILDEVRYELQWFLTMQRGDGAFHFKVTRAQFEGFIMPQNDAGARNIYAVSSTATGDAVAVLARGARLFGSYDTAFARICREAAVRGWQFLSAHGDIVPAGGFTNPSGTVTGEYGDTDDSDERLWAAAELFETTGLSAYHDAFQGGLVFGSQFSGTMSWGDVRPLALLTYLQSNQPAAVASVQSDLLSSLTSYCASRAARRNTSGYQTVLQPGEYNWGSNSSALNAAVLLLSGGTETGDTSYVRAAADQLHYVLGVNGLSRSFVTGSGENPPVQPHHRPSASDGVAAPVPGLLVGGPNQYRQDDVLQALFTTSTPPALCYADSLPSYASNEIAINWNAPLVFVAGYFRGMAGPTDVRRGELQVPGFKLEQNFPNPFNPTTMIRYHIPSGRPELPGGEKVTLSVYDLLGREVALLVNEQKRPGTYAVLFDSTGLASGPYLCCLSAGGSVQARRMVVLK
jgi:endoglucanase